MNSFRFAAVFGSGLWAASILVAWLRDNSGFEVTVSISMTLLFIWIAIGAIRTADNEASK